MTFAAASNSFKDGDYPGKDYVLPAGIKNTAALSAS
jgi:hypothetical protein